MKVGDKVSALDEDIAGIITKIHEDQITIESDGFEMVFNKSELIVEQENDLGALFTNTDINKLIAEKERSDKSFKTTKSVKERYQPTMEVDLHAQELTSSTKGMSKHDVLNLQINTAKHKLEFAMKKNIQKVVFIHGVGEGVLKMELEYLFGQFENLKYYDADYKKYGYGATEVYIFQDRN